MSSNPLLRGSYQADRCVKHRPGVISYLCTFYRRENLGLRIAAFYAASPVAGAFGGLLAYGVFSIKSHLHGWQILFLLEGGLTVTTGLIALFVKLELLSRPLRES